MIINTNQKQDYKWFAENIGKLHERYGHRFLAIKDKTVLGDYDSYAMGVRKTSETEEIGSFIVQECAESVEACAGSIASMNFV